MKSMFLAAWRYRQFILSSIRNDFAGRFARSKIGALWMILHPLAQVLIYALVLSAVLSAKLPGIDNQFAYSIYLTAGILGWSLFSELISRGLTLFIDNGNLLKKIVFPRVCLPLIMGGSALINSVLLLGAILAIFAVLGHAPGLNALWLPLLIAITLLLGTALGLILGLLNTFIRDIGQVVPVLLQFAFWFTPIVYTVDIIPEVYRDLLQFNPMYPLIVSFQNVLVFDKAPDFYGISVVGAAAAALLGLSLFMFRRANAELVEVL